MRHKYKNKIVLCFSDDFYASYTNNQVDNSQSVPVLEQRSVELLVLERDCCGGEVRLCVLGHMRQRRAQQVKRLTRRARAQVQSAQPGQQLCDEKKAMQRQERDV